MEPAGEPVELGLFEDGRKALVSMLRRNILIGTGLREEYMTHRPHVERAIAQVATWRGRQLKLRYRGTARNHAWLKRRAVALNLRNLLGKGLARRDGAGPGHLTRRRIPPRPRPALLRRIAGHPQATTPDPAGAARRCRPATGRAKCPRQCDRCGPTVQARPHSAGACG